MKFTIRSLFAGSAFVAGLVLATPATANAQGLKLQEIRLDLASLSLTGGTELNAGMPGAAAIGLFFNEKIALEPSVSLTAREGSTEFGVGGALAYYLEGNHGKSGLFVAPNLALTKKTDADAAFNYGVDAGIKIPMHDNVSIRLAGTLRDGDSYADMSFGAVFGISYYLK